MQPQLPPAIRACLEALRVHEAITGNRSDDRLEEKFDRTARALNDLGVQWCLVGAQALAHYIAPRATKDVDLVVDDRRMNAILKELERVLGPLGAEDIGPAVRLESLSIDLIRASSSTVFREAMRHVEEHDGWRVPKLEVMVVLRFMSAVSPWRGKNKTQQDLVDLAQLYRSVDPDDIDRDLIARLATQIYPGAERELAELLEKIDRDEPLQI